MGKILTVPAVKSVANIISQSNFGDLVDNGDGTITANNISPGPIKKLFNVSQYSVYELVSSPQVNRWSTFKPGILQASSSSYDISYNRFGAKELGDFAGYNHNELGPYFDRNLYYETYDDIFYGIGYSYINRDFHFLQLGNINQIISEIYDANDNFLHAIQTPIADSLYQADPAFNNGISVPVVGDNLYYILAYFAFNGSKVAKLPHASYLNDNKINVRVVKLLPAFVGDEVDYTDQGLFDNTWESTVAFLVNTSYNVDSRAYSFQIHYVLSSNYNLGGVYQLSGTTDLFVENSLGTRYQIASNARFTIGQYSGVISGTLPYTPSSGEEIKIYGEIKSVTDSQEYSGSPA